MKISKTITEGSLVRWHGDKIVRCGKRYKPIGVYTGGGSRVTLTVNDERVRTVLPAGVIISGPATAKLAAGEKGGKVSVYLR